MTAATFIMESQLASIGTLPQKDKGPAYSSLLRATLSSPNESTVSADLQTFVDAVVNQDNLLVGRQILSEVVKYLADGSIKDGDLKKTIVQDTLSAVLPKIISYEEQVCIRVVTSSNSCSSTRLLLYDFNWQTSWRRRKNGARRLVF